MLFQKERFSNISENGTLHFSAQDRRMKDIHPGKIYYTSGNGNPEAETLK